MAQIVYYFSSALSLGAPGPAGLLHRADRQFRRHLRRLRRQAHGPADRAAGHRHQRQRHSGAHAGDAANTRRAASSRPPRRRWTSRCRRISSGCCSRRPAATPPTVRRYMDGLKQSGAFTIEAGAARRHPRRISPPAARRWTRPPRRSARRSQRAATCSTRTPRPAVHVADRHSRLRRRRWWCSPPPIRPSFRPRSKQPAASRPRCPPGSADLMAAQGKLHGASIRR